MKRGVIAGVVAAHVAMLAALLFLFQGCGKTTKVSTPAPAASPKGAMSEPVLPPGEQKPVSQIPATPLPKPPSKAEVKPPPLPPPSAIHVVAKGENLTTIAKKYGVKAADLMALNQIANANRLRVGQELVVPNVSAPGATSSGIPILPAAAQSDSEIVYTVAKGDFLGRIASRHGTTVAVIKQRNGLKTDTVRIGQKLKIPVKEGAMPAPKVEATAPAPMPETKPVKEAPGTPKAPPVPTVKVNPPPSVSAPVLPPTPAAAPAPVTAKKPAIDLDAKPVAAPSADLPKAGAADAVPLLVHEVQPNEDLVKIAMMYGVSVEAVKKANGMTGESVRPGQRLKIP